MKRIINRYRNLDGIINVAHDATVVAAIVAVFLIASI